MSDERKRENEEEKLKDFFHNVIGIKSEAVLEVLAENSEICLSKFMIPTKNFADEREREGKALVGIMNLDKQITSFLTVELITDCEIVRISADVLRKLAMENIEIALVCNRMQSVASMREYEYRKMILTCNPVQRYEYFLETYPGLEKYDGA